MSTRVVDRVEDWEERSFAGGYRELHDLADSEFSGVVRAGGAELYMTKGVVVGVRQGDIEDFADARGTIYESPSPALPLLAVMQERGGDVRDEFYSEKTSISEVDSTLSDGGFTGYIELSENVLSGDYYLVYQAGRSMSVGFVGNAGRLIDGDEAFETADDEVGIYKVHAVDVDPIEIPQPSGSGSGGTTSGGTDTTAAGADTTAAGGNTTGGGTGESAASAGADDRGTPADEPAESAAGRGSAGQATQQQPAETDAAGAADAGTAGGTAEDGRRADAGRDPESTAEPRETATDSRESTADRRETAADSRDSTGESRGSATEDRETAAGSADPAAGAETRETGDSRAPEAGTTERRDQGASQQPEPAEPDRTPERDDRTAGSAGAAAGDRQQASAAGEADAGGDWDQAAARDRAPAEGASTPDDEALGLEQRAIPSLDPDRSDESDGSSAGSARDSLERSRGRDSAGQSQARQRDARQGPDQGTGRSGTAADARQQPEESRQPERAQGAGQSQPQQPRQSGGAGQPQQPEPAVDPEHVEQLEADLEEREAEIDRLEDELASATRERDDLREQLETVREERDELQAEVDRLSDELDRLEDELGAATEAERRITGEEALSGTDVFVRYHSKGDATLEKAHGGSTRKEDVNENLRLEKHTQFDADSVAVGAQSYEEYLDNTVEYQFVEWLVRQLLFEIRDTGHQKELQTLYDVLPAVDRAELAGVVDVVYTADGQETRSQESFDIILRDRMGNPLLVANLNDSREAATEAMMEDLITAAERVGQSAEQFAGAFLVTRSFFDPGALEVAEDATQGGLLSRDKRKSFVNLSRKQGYHLCLVEARNENFHLAVPEL